MHTNRMLDSLTHDVSDIKQIMKPELIFFITNQDMNTMLKSQPQSAAVKAIETWITLGPLSQMKTVIRSPPYIGTANHPHLEYKRVDYGNNYQIGYCKHGTESRYGIGRTVWKNSDVQEGMYINDKLNGYGRKIYADGSHYVGMATH